MTILWRRFSKICLLGSTALGLATLSACIDAGDDSGSAGGSGGSSGSGGSGGSGPSNTVCARPIVLSVSKPGIADFESYKGEPLGDFKFPLGGDSSTGLLSGTFGYGDHEVVGGNEVPEAFEMVDGYDSTYALSISDTLAEKWGGGMGLWISDCVNATAFQGISFWARGSSPTGKAKLSIPMQESTENTAPKPGTCVETGTEEMKTCVHPYLEFPITDEWTRVEAPWSAMVMGDAGGTRFAPDGRNIWQIQFDIGLEWLPDDQNMYHPTPAPYELVIDDVSFF